MNIQDYIPHALVVAFGSVVSYVYRDHVKRDDARFADVREDYKEISAKLDTQNSTAAANHAEILRILAERRDV